MELQTLKKWARGASKDAQYDDDEEEDGLEAEGEEEELEEGESNPVWNADVDPESITPEEGEEFWGWLQEHEPEIFSAIDDIARGVAETDEQMIAHGEEELESAQQFLTPEYHAFDAQERSKVTDSVRNRVKALGAPAYGSTAWMQAVAAALAEVRANPGPEEDEEEEQPVDENLREVV